MGMLWRKFRRQLVGVELDNLIIPFQPESMWFHELHCPWFPVFWHFLSAAWRQAGRTPPPVVNAPPSSYSREAGWPTAAQVSGWQAVSPGACRNLRPSRSAATNTSGVHTTTPPQTLAWRASSLNDLGVTVAWVSQGWNRTAGQAVL